MFKDTETLLGSLTKDLPVLGVLGDQVKHVLGLHHLRKGEDAWGGGKGKDGWENEIRRETAFQKSNSG